MNTETHGLIVDMLEAWEEQFGDGACDCQPEPQNHGHICVWCRARLATLPATLAKQRIEADLEAGLSAISKATGGAS